MADKEVKLLGYWASPHTVSVRWALKLKGIAYDYQEEDLSNKSPQLLEYNPVHKKVPVLVHNGKPVAESLIIIEYIDETWSLHNTPLLPQEPCQRAKARFWAKFAHEKCVPAMVNTFLKVGEEQEKNAIEAREHLKTLESGIIGGGGGGGGKPLFLGGESIGFVDIAAGWIGYWGRTAEEIVNIKLIDEETMPLLASWFDNVLQHPILKECLPPWDKLIHHNQGSRNRMILAAATAAASSTS